MQYVFFLISVLFLSLVIWLIRTKKGKGISGELVVASFLNKLDKSEYFIINDITLKVGNNTSQIDHIVVSPYGIFAIETKNWRGKIYGNRWSKKWTQYISGFPKKYKNPIRQNIGHIWRLKEVLSDYPNLKYISIIAFSGETKRKMNDDITIKVSEILETIGRYQDVVISKEDVESIYKRLKSLEKEGKAYEKEHVENIRRRNDKG